MKKSLLFVAVLFSLLVSVPQVSAQLIIRNNGHAEIGHDPFDPVPEGLPSNYYNDLDTVSALKIFGSRGELASGAHISFGDQLLWDSYNVNVGELGYTDTDCLWLHGKHGTYLTAGVSATDTIVYYDYKRSQDVNFRKNVTTTGVFVQSDERFKENVEPVEGVLSSLENLEAVSYTLKNDNARQCRAAINDIPALTEKDRRDKAFFDQYYAEQEQGDERYGFLAQNVKEVFPQLVHTDNSGYMYVDYIGLIPILVQSINELNAKIEALTGEKQEDDVAALLRQAMQASQGEMEASLNAPKLYQNSPNPWSSETVIRYSLPQNVATACIYIYDMQGAQLKSVPAQGRGESQVTLSAHDLNAGMYIYALVADGQLIDSKQMILTK
jgi:hypothetical protein